MYVVWGESVLLFVYRVADLLEPIHSLVAGYVCVFAKQRHSTIFDILNSVAVGV